MNNFSEYKKMLDTDHALQQYTLYKKAFNKYKKIIIIGNGGSNSIASHLSQDFIKFSGKKAISFSDPSMLTCFINDFGIEHAYVKFLEAFADVDTLCILISSGGESKNIINCVRWCKYHSVPYGVLTGFDKNNTVRLLADSAYFNYHVDSKNYGVVECIHQIFLHAEEKKVINGIIAGGFDIMHPGYMQMFEEAKTYCSVLTVALHIDPSIERSHKLKPIHTVEERKQILLGIKYIDNIVVYNTENELCQIFESGTYDLRFLGADYKNKNYTGSNINIPIVWLSRNHSYSSTLLKTKIYESILKQKKLGVEYD